MRNQMIFIVIGAILFVPMSAMGGELATPAPAFHEEISRVWDEL